MSIYDELKRINEDIENDTISLKGCPFCGSTDLEIGIRGISCNSCDAAGPANQLTEIINNWNIRSEE